MRDAPDALNRIVDVVLKYRPKPKTKAARKRKSRKAKLDKDAAKTGQPDLTARKP
jgi:hypothetical protein